MVGFEGMQILDAIGPLEVFAQASRLLMAKGGDGDAIPAYRVVLAAQPAGPVACSLGLSVVAHCTPAALGQVDTLLVAGGTGTLPGLSDPVLIDWLRSHAPRARRLGSVCTGTLLLARAGLLRGRRGTTHSAYIDQLATLEPSAHVERDAIFVNDESLWTSAGVTAGMDMALAMVQADWDRKLALEVARVLLMSMQRAGGAPRYSAALESQSRGVDGRFGRLAAWIAGNLDAELTIDALAREAEFSLRHFARCFHEEMGTTPAKFVERMRFEAAQQMIADGQKTVAEVAQSCGFGSAETLRRVFIRRAGCSPAAYRARVCERAADNGTIPRAVAPVAQGIERPPPKR
jgi:transcriptional regulator GlxA family with amidase domain